MYCISVSHKTTPTKIRQLFSFSEREQREFSRKLLSEHKVNGCIIVSTCNRSEIYFTCDDNEQEGTYTKQNNDCSAMTWLNSENKSLNIRDKHLEEVANALSEFKGIELDVIMNCCEIFYEKEAIRHLFKVACGLESMVLGEDEILRQIKEAYLFASELNSSNGEIHMIFQGAFHCAKKIKTITKLSTTSVSIGTLTANCVSDFIREQKTETNKVLLVGATGKIGSIVAKNLLDKGIDVIGTKRSYKSKVEHEIDSRIKIVEFDKRYEYIKEATVIISATASPHYTFTYERLSSFIEKEKQYMMIDLSVPYDIEKKIGMFENVQIYDIDYFKELSTEHNDIKCKEVKKALLFIEEILEETLKKVYMRAFKLENNATHDKWIDNILYHQKESLDSEQFRILLHKIKSMEEGEIYNGVLSFSD